jgi:hypothetical protein
MRVVKAGKSQYRRIGEFFFYCSVCECEWKADRGDRDVSITPPCLPFDVYCKCPCCGRRASYKDSIRFHKK